MKPATLPENSLYAVASVDVQAELFIDVAVSPLVDFLDKEKDLLPYFTASGPYDDDNDYGAQWYNR